MTFLACTFSVKSTHRQVGLKLQMRGPGTPLFNGLARATPLYTAMILVRLLFPNFLPSSELEVEPD